MTKVKLSKLEKIFYLISAILALAAIIMMVGTAIVPTEATGVKQKIDAGFYGYELVFGLKDGDLSGLKFSVLALIPYVLALAGIVLLIFRIIDKFISKKFDFLIVALLLVASLLFFFSGNFVVYSANLVGELFASFDYRLSYGLIISGVSAVLSAGFTFSSFVLSEFVKVTEEQTENKKEEQVEHKTEEKTEESKETKTEK